MYVVVFTFVLIYRKWFVASVNQCRSGYISYVFRCVGYSFLICVVCVMFLGFAFVSYISNVTISSTGYIFML